MLCHPVMDICQTSQHDQQSGTEHSKCCLHNTIWCKDMRSQSIFARDDMLGHSSSTRKNSRQRIALCACLCDAWDRAIKWHRYRRIDKLRCCVKYFSLHSLLHRESKLHRRVVDDQLLWSDGDYLGFDLDLFGINGRSDDKLTFLQ